MSDGFRSEEVDAVEAPPKARVVLDTDTDAERKRDYLAGFLAQKPQADSPGEPGGATYEAIVDALNPVNVTTMRGSSYDAGDMRSYMQTFIYFAQHQLADKE